MALNETNVNPVRPLTDTVRRHLELLIAQNQPSTRERLPSARSLAAELGVSRNTVTAAYQELVSEGFVEARSKSGYYINAEVAILLREGRNSQRICDETEARPPLRLRFQGDPFPHVNKPDIWNRLPYPFICGQVNLGAFPARAWLRYLSLALQGSHRAYSLSDRPEADDPLLVEMLCEKVLPGRGIHASPQMVMITLGTQGGLALVADLLAGPGVTAAVEDPGYPDTRHILHRAGWRIETVPVDDSGARIDSLSNDVQLLYVTPSHQFPTNVTLSIARRRQVIDLCSSGDLLVVEDDYDSEFRYIGRPTPALKSFPKSEHILYFGSFSKFLAPGLRLGYLVGPSELLRALRQHQRYQLRHPPGHIQRALALMIQSGNYTLHLNKQRNLLKRNWTTTLAAARRHFPFDVPTTAGGTSIWFTAPKGFDSLLLASRALEHGILIESGIPYYYDPAQGKNHFRLGFIAIDEHNIEPGVQILGNLIVDQLGKS